jgi:rubrerythrin
MIHTDINSTCAIDRNMKPATLLKISVSEEEEDTKYYMNPVTSLLKLRELGK